MTSVSKKILLVDDEEDLTWSISRSLRKENEKYDIICVNSGDEALKFLKRIYFDLLISDIRMPGQDGFALLSYVTKYRPNMKVIIMSACYDPELNKVVKKTSNIFYIEKPFDIGNLKMIINQALDNTSKKYKGRLIDLSLKDIIRHNYHNKLNGHLNIFNGKEKGVIYFRSGELIHVKVGEKEGECALLNVLNWNDFEYDTVIANKPIKKNINLDWKLLIEN